MTARTDAAAEIGDYGCGLLFQSTAETSAVKPGTLLTDDEVFGVDEWWTADPTAPAPAQ